MTHEVASLSAAFCLLLAGALVAGSPSYARDDKLDSSLREAVHSVPVAAAGASIVVTSFRPHGAGPFRWIVLSHGTATPDTHPGQPCEPERLAELFASITPQIAVPVLWFYAENDQYIGPAAAKLWLDSFRALPF